MEESIMENSFAVITHATTDIGQSLAEELGEAGHELLIVSNSDEVFELQRTLEEKGYQVEAFKANLATYAGVENLYQRILNFGKILEVLVINSKRHNDRSFIETKFRKDINLINSNVLSLLHLTKRVLPEMTIRGKGRLIFTSSTTSTSGPVELATKAFIDSFAHSLKKECKNSGVVFEYKRSTDNFITKIQSYAMKILPDKVNHKQEWSDADSQIH
jgi:uncharacterized protein